MSKRKSITENGFKCVLAIAAFTLLTGTIAYAKEDTVFVPGTSVNGIRISGQTVGEAREKLENYYGNDYTLTIIGKNGESEKIKGFEIGLKAQLLQDITIILEEQNASGGEYGPSVDNSYTVEVKTSFDEALLETRVNNLSFVSGDDVIQTENARISSYEEGKPFQIIPQVMGNSVDAEMVLDAVRDRVAAGKVELDLGAAGCYESVTITADSEALQQLCDRMNQYTDMEITFDMGVREEKLGGGEICTWFLGTEDGEISVDTEQAADYVKFLADTYDTADTARTFRTAGGKDVSLTGPYGWKIDQAATVTALADAVRAGESKALEPIYSKTAADRSGTDWGSTYAEIDLTGQHTYLFENGSLVWDAPCVTGNIEKGHTTPDGIYSLNYKQTDRILRGEKQADGTYEYESPVDYWMPFNGGIGLHDASWRNKFGGTIYQYAGSHGCINLPPDKAEILYEKVYSGIPVICYQ